MTKRKKATFWSEPIGKVDLQTPAIVPSGTSIIDSVREMKNNHIGCVLVVDAKKKLIGILSNGDLMHNFVGTTLTGDTPVDEIMTTNPASVQTSLTVQEALEIFDSSRFRHLPVLKGSKIEGILSVRGLMTFISEHLPHQVMNLPPDSSLVASRPSGE
jgi:CBS domain-containing protein